jgi:preprotein translocase subunit YajC
MYATVVAVDGDDVVLEVAPGVEVRYLRRAIMEVIAPGEPETADAEPEAYADDEHEAYAGEEPEAYAADEHEPAGTTEPAQGVASAEEGLADSHDDLAKSDKK